MFKYLISIVFIIYIFYVYGDTIDVANLNLDYTFFIFIIIFSILSLSFINFRFILLFKIIEKKNKRISIPFFASLRGVAFSVFPFLASSEIIKFYDLHKSIGKNKTTQLILLEKFLGLTSNLIIMIVILNFFFFNYFKLSLFYLIIEFFLIFFFLKSKIFSKVLNKILYINFFYQKLSFIDDIFYKILFPLGLSFLSQLLALFIVLIIANYFLGINIDNVFGFLFFIQITNLISSLPISIAGIGIRDFLFLYFVQPFFYFSSEKSILLSMSMNFFVIILSIIAFLISLTSVYSKHEK